ncbi:hypothetical protein LR48_Vigan03g063000 [Vigna angularis]|uniref:Ubiquitin-like protease family profile domain-containing protein n=1 Tax=Phaseolus angularis TaxID=3914 RepID=A0A0L9U4B6_PHAAN|nr:hypothetical protein LR48_Vigan03g063000 [Vigna angularis]
MGKGDMLTLSLDQVRHQVSHVSILHASWDDVSEVEKNLLWQDIQKNRKSRADALGLNSPDLAPAPARYELWKAAQTKSDGNMTSSSVALISQRIFTRPHKQSIHDTVIDENDDMAEVEDDPLSKLMTRLPRYKDTIVVDQGRSSMYGFVEPQTIQPSSTLESKQHYLQRWMDESKRDVYLVPYIDGKMKTELRTMLQGVIGKSRGQLVQILYPKVCNKQLDSWECGFYVMCWIKTIIRVVITGDWNESSLQPPSKLYFAQLIMEQRPHVGVLARYPNWENVTLHGDLSVLKAAFVHCFQWMTPVGHG